MSNPELQPIKTERMLLRERDPELDAEDIFDFWKIPEVLKYTTRTIPTSASDVRTFQIKGRLPISQQAIYAITVPPTSAELRARHPDLPSASANNDAHEKSTRDHRVIGIMGAHKYPEIGYTLHPSFHGRGLMTEALRAVIPALWEIIPSVAEAEQTGAQGWDYLMGICDVENKPSQRVMEKMGFVRGEIIEGEYTSPQLGLRDAVPFFLPRPGTELPAVLRKGMGAMDGQRPVPDVQ